MMRVGQAKGAPGVTARSVEGHTVTVRAHAAVDNAIAVAAVHGDKRIDLFSAVAEQVLNAAKVAKALLTDVADEQNLGFGFQLGMLHCAQHFQHRYQSPGIVADAGRDVFVALDFHGDVGSFGKHGVEVRGIGDPPVVAVTGASPDHVADPVYPDILEAGVPQHFREALGPRCLIEWRCRNLCQFDEVFQRLCFETVHVLHGRLDFRVCPQRFDLAAIFPADLRRRVVGVHGRRGDRPAKQGRQRACEQ